MFFHTAKSEAKGVIDLRTLAVLVPYIALLHVLFFAHAGAQAPPPASPQFARGDRVEALAVDIFDWIIYVPMTVNGAGPMPFVLDTGAGTFSALDQAVAESLGLPLTLVRRGGGAGEEQVEIHNTDSVTVALPGITFTDRLIFTIPLHRLDPHWGKTKDGLLGGDLLSTLVTRIDYENERIDFYDAAAYEYDGPGERIPLTIENNFLYLETEVLLYGNDDPIKAFFLLDTGVRLTLFNSPFSMTHALPAQSPSTVEGVTGFGIGGVSRGIVGRVRGIRMGSVLIENPVVDFSTDTSGALAEEGFSGIIGADFLSRFHVVLDYKRSQMFLEKNNRFDAPHEFDMCGIRFVLDGERFELTKVFSIFEPSPAAEAGIQPGDIITKIDGREASGFTWEDLKAYMLREGETVEFTIERDGETMTVNLVVKKMG
jgi:predicted aspartyl protease